MSWDRLDAARRLSSESTTGALRLLIDSEAATTALPASEVSRIGHFVDEAAARIAHGGTIHLVAAGPVRHLILFAAEESRHWFPEVFPVSTLTGGDEDSDEEAIALVDRHVSPDDVALCVSRSGARAWTCAAIRKANMTGALTGSITCVPDSPVSRESDLPIVVPSGAEVVMGCTQYGAATVVKVTLDAVLLGLALRAGGVRGDVPVMANVGAETWRLVAAAADIDHLQARSLVARSEGSAPVAIVMAKLGIDAEEARRRLAAARLEDVIGRP